MLDGRIARLTKTTTEIGIQLDSIADVVTFGLGAGSARLCLGIWIYPRKVPIFIARMVPVVHVFDLRRVSSSAFQRAGLAPACSRRRHGRKVDKKSFVGLPIPVAGGLIAALVHFSPMPLIYFRT
jgi:CDP-diacylglycerol--serine O-phosphatidyltransferase